jgi:predicted amidohydrolase
MPRYAVDPATSPYVSEVALWAAERCAWVILGCTRRAPDGLYNSALILNREGQLAGIYDKLHCRGADEKVCQGQHLPVFDGDFGPFGVMICADRRRPEVARSLALAGARIVFNPTYGACNELNAQVIRVRAFENELFIAQAHPNQALITGPDGDIVLDQTANSTPHGTAAVDLARVDQKRQSRKSLLKDRRPEMYRLS